MNLTRWAKLLSVVFTFFKVLQTTNCDDINAPVAYNKKLDRKMLIVVTGEFPPPIFPLLDASGRIIGYSGHYYQLLLWLSAKLGFTYQIILAKENTNGVKINGTWNGIIGTLQRQEADLGLVPVAITLERYEAIEFCGNMGSDGTGILVKYPPASVSFSSAFDVFSHQVWIGFVLSGIAVVAFLKFMSHLAVHKRDAMSFESAASWTWSTAISQGIHFPWKFRHLKLIAATWYLAAFVFVNVYNSTLASYMSVTYQQPEINSFKDLADSKTYKTGVSIGSIQERILLNAKNGPMKEIGYKILKCDDCREFSANSLEVKVLEKENYVAVMPSSVGRGFMQKFSSERGHCRLTMAKDTAAFQHMHMAVPKSSPYIEDINRETLWFHAFGFRNLWVVNREKYPKQCMLQYNSKGQAITKLTNKRLKLEQFYLPFLILFGGYLLAFMQFVREWLYAPTKRVNPSVKPVESAKQMNRAIRPLAESVAETSSHLCFPPNDNVSTPSQPSVADERASIRIDPTEIEEIVEISDSKQQRRNYITK